MHTIREYVVVSSQMATQSTLVVLLRDYTGRKTVKYKPGQYAAISFFHKNRPTPSRCFSITSSPTEEGYLQFALKVGGDFTKTAVKDLAVGSKVVVEGPFGHFIFDEERDKSALLLAGGIGITPFISMLRYAARLQLTNDVLLVFSCHTQDDIPFFAELIQMQQTNPHLHVVFVVGTGPIDKLAGLSVMTGRVDKKLLDQITSKVYSGRSYFICGPAPFMSAMSKTLIQSGASEDAVFTEAFAQGQKSTRGFRGNLPLQVYTLTAASVVLGTATILIGDSVSTTPVSSANSSGKMQGSGTSNSRESDVNQTINQLQNGSDTAGTDSQGAVDPNTTPAANTPPSTGTTTPKAAKSSPGKPAGGGSSTGSSGGGSTGSGSGSGTGSGSGSGSGGTPNPPPPPPPPAPVAPKLTFTASSTSITIGESVVLSWLINSDATSPVTCTASGSWTGTKATSGSKTFQPTSTRTYKLACSNSAGSSSKSITINVAPACFSTPSNPC